jgi:hypothetical protein
MDVFISWSGDFSKKVAQLLREWLPNVIQDIKPFMSSEDIDKGTIWFGEIADKFKDSQFSILCLTKSNLNAPWILFEAGALLKRFGKAKVSPLLVGVSNSDLSGPLYHFNTTSTEKDDLKRLLKTLNKCLEDKELEDAKVERFFEKWWPDFDSQLKEIQKEFVAEMEKKEHPKGKPEQTAMIEEVLIFVRKIAQMVAEDHQSLTGVKNQMENIMPKLHQQYYLTKNQDRALTKEVYDKYLKEIKNKLDVAQIRSLSDLDTIIKLKEAKNTVEE